MPDLRTQIALNTSGGPNRQARRHPIQQAFIGIPEAATYLGVAEKTIRRFIRDDKLPAYRLGNRVIKIKIEDLETVLSRVGGDAS
jgi:excisionase family DNA binding protein